MGRYFTGDIEGKFWFGVQPSNVAERFGAVPLLHYDFTEDDIESVEKEINEILNHIGIYKKMFDDFFEEHPSYNHRMMVEYGFPDDRLDFLLSEYADLLFGQKVLECIKLKGQCSIDCEC